MSPSSDRARLWRRCLVAAVLGGLAATLPAGPASAHATAVRSDPAQSATVAAAPREVHIWFDEEIVPTLAGAQFVDAHGRQVGGAAAVRVRNDDELVVPAPPNLGTGTFGVSWHVVAADDGHPSEGMLAFSVGRATAGSTLQTGTTFGAAGDRLGATALRWIALGLLAVVAGALAVGLLVVPSSADPAADAEVRELRRHGRRRLLGFAAIASAAAVVVGMAELVAEARLLDSSVADVAGTRWGLVWAVREVAFLGVAALAVRSRRRPSASALTAFLLVALLVVLAWTEAARSHPAAQQAWAPYAGATVHVLTAVTWVGAVAALLVLWRASRRDPAVRRRLALAVRGRFAALAGGSVVAVVASGLYLAGAEVEQPAQLTGTEYGLTLLVKVAVVGLVLLLGGLNWLGLRRGDPWLDRLPVLRRPAGFGGSSRTILTEVIAGAAVLLAAAVLAGTPPPPRASANVTGHQAVAGVVLGDLVISTTLEPGRPGLNAVTALVASTRRPALYPIDGVRMVVRVDGRQLVVDVRPVRPGRYAGTVVLPAGRIVGVTAQVHRNGRDETVDLGVPAGITTGTDVVPGTPLSQWTDNAAIVVLGAGAAVGIGVAVRRRRGSGGAPPAAVALTGADAQLTSTV